MSEPTDEARAWASQVIDVWARDKDSKFVQDILAAEVLPIMRERDQLLKRVAELGADGPDHLTPTERNFMNACLSRADRAEFRQSQAEERARRAEEERDKLIAELSKCAWHSAIDEASEDAEKFAAGERRWKEIADDMGRTLECPQATCRHEPSCPGCAALARYEAARKEP